MLTAAITPMAVSQLTRTSLPFTRTCGNWSRSFVGPVAVKHLRASVPPRITYFLFPPNPFNALAHRVAGPIANNFRTKLAKAKVARVGESPYKTDRRFLTFQRRDFVG